jgi:hypothetical protein
MTGMVWLPLKTQAAVYTQNRTARFAHPRQIFTAEAQRRRGNAKEGETERCSWWSPVHPKVGDGGSEFRL